MNSLSHSSARGSGIEPNEADDEVSPQGFIEDVLSTGVTQTMSDEARVQPHEIGVMAEVKPLYEGRVDYCRCCKVWDDEKPADPDDAHLRKLTEKQRQRYAILWRQCRHGRGTWKTDSIVINSTILRHLLVSVFTDYPAVDPHAVELSFFRPFLPFVHRWEQLTQTLDATTDQDARKHLTLLIDLLRPEVEPMFNTLRNIESTGFVAFDDLTLLYMTGEIIIQSLAGVSSAGLLRSVHKASHASYYIFSVDVVDWNGEVFGVRKDSWMLFGYEGSRRLKELSIMPLRCLEDPKDTREKLIARGKLFKSLAGCHFRSYTGKASIYRKSPDNPFQPPFQSYTPISERVIVDTGSYYTLQGKVPPELRPLKDVEKSAVQPPPHGHVHDGLQADLMPSQHRHANVMPPPHLYPHSGAPQKQRLTNEEFSAAVAAYQAPEIQDYKHSSIGLPELTDGKYLLTVPRIKGFAIHSKLWCEFEVSALKAVVWKTTALGNLVLGDKEKRLLTAIIASQMRKKEVRFDDFVDGKGKGVIILLSGSPGVGKTLTAESVAEHLERPLYRLGAADLGSTITAVEQRLNETLLRCAAWSAVLLIDEADVFLESRSADSLERNELISIFLRLLEYYTGVLILTTNRVSSIDTAFESRIDISLHYAELPFSARAQVLSNFLQTLGPEMVDISEPEIRELAQNELNGRQIKSAVKTARMLAESEGVKLNKSHMEIVLSLREKAKQELAVAS